MKNNARGVSLMTLILSIGISAIILGAVGALYDNLTTLRQEAVLIAEAEHVVHLVQDQLNDPAICGKALRKGLKTSGSPDGPVVWPGPLYEDINNISAFNRIEIHRPGKLTNTTDGKQILVLAKYGDSLAAINGTASTQNGGTRITLDSMILRQPTSAEGGPVRTQIRQSYTDAGTTAFRFVNVIAAKVQFNFKTMTQLFPSNNGFLPPRSVSLNVELDPTTYQMVGCYAPSGASTQSLSCPMDTVTPCPAPSPGCTQFQYMSGFDVNGAPVCSCSITCNSPPIGPPGIYVPPPPPPAGKTGSETEEAMFAPLKSRLNLRAQTPKISLINDASILGEITHPIVPPTRGSLFKIPNGGALRAQADN